MSPVLVANAPSERDADPASVPDANPRTSPPRDRDAFLSTTHRRFLGQLEQLPDAHPVKVPAAAEMCSVHRTTFWRWIRSGLLPRPTKIGNVATLPLGLIRKIQREGLPPKQADRSLRTGG